VATAIGLGRVATPVDLHPGRGKIKKATPKEDHASLVSTAHLEQRYVELFTCLKFHLSFNDAEPLPSAGF
jgi:hypothetical protein